MEKKKSGLATAGMVLGIIGACLSFVPIINNAAFVLGALAVIFGIICLVKKVSMGKTVTSLILGILAIVITLAMQASMVQAIDEAVNGLDDSLSELETDLNDMTGDNTEELLQNNVDVVLGEFQYIEGEIIDETKLVATVKNKGSESSSYSIQVEAVDASGNRITSDYIYVDTLGAGQSQDFEIFNLLTDEEAEKLQTATFNIVEVSMY